VEASDGWIDVPEVIAATGAGSRAG
jgi:hypothetical protein